MSDNDETTTTSETAGTWPPEARFAEGDRALAKLVGKLREVIVVSAWWDPHARPPRWTYNLREPNGVPWVAGEELLEAFPVEEPPRPEVAETWPPEAPSTPVVDPSLLAESPSRDAAVDLFGEPITRAADVMDPDAVPEVVPDAPAPPHGEAPPVPAGPSWSLAGWADEGETVSGVPAAPEPSYAASEAPTITLAEIPVEAVARMYDAEDAPTASGVPIEQPEDPDLSWLGEPTNAGNTDPFLTPAVVNVQHVEVEEERTEFYAVELADVQRVPEPIRERSPDPELRENPTVRGGFLVLRVGAQWCAVRVGDVVGVSTNGWTGDYTQRVEVSVAGHSRFVLKDEVLDDVVTFEVDHEFDGVLDVLERASRYPGTLNATE